MLCMHLRVGARWGMQAGGRRPAGKKGRLVETKSKERSGEEEFEGMLWAIDFG